MIPKKKYLCQNVVTKEFQYLWVRYAISMSLSTEFIAIKNVSSVAFGRLIIV